MARTVSKRASKPKTVIKRKSTPKASLKKKALIGAGAAGGLGLAVYLAMRNKEYLKSLKGKLSKPKPKSASAPKPKPTISSPGTPTSSSGGRA